LKLWNTLPLAAHSAERIVVVRFAWFPTRVSGGGLVWLERVRYTLDKQRGEISIYWAASKIERVRSAKGEVQP